jgi:hypothetical protein
LSVCPPFTLSFAYLATHLPNRLELAQRILGISFKRLQTDHGTPRRKKECGGSVVLSAIYRSTRWSARLFLADHPVNATTNRYATIDLEIKRQAIAHVRPPSATLHGERIIIFWNGWEHSKTPRNVELLPLSTLIFMDIVGSNSTLCRANC